MKEVRVRYAPSPTGYLHIGGARSALFNFLYAKKYNGKFIFRSEDTDVARNVEGGEESQYKDLKWLGIFPDESPFEPNEKYAPYRQTERLDIYHKYAEQLIKEGKAYYCYCSEEELASRKEEQLALGIKATYYDGKCRELTEEQIEKYKSEGRVPCIRIKVPSKKEYSFNDLVRGEMKFSSSDIGGDFVIMKSNGIPTYNFAVVVDDHLMEISHVFRGEEHLSNTPKQLVVYEAFGWEAPEFGHMTIIINKDGKKLSKRDLDIVQFVSQYRKMGFINDAIVNYLLQLGWNAKDNREFYNYSELANVFNPEYLSKAPSTFDFDKLKWMNAHYIRKMNDGEYFRYIRYYIDEVFSVRHQAEKKVIDIANMFKYEISYGQEIIEPLKEALNTKPLDEEGKEIVARETSKSAFKALANQLEQVDDWEIENIRKAIKAAHVDSGLKGKDFYMPIRLLITGMSHGIELYNILYMRNPMDVIKLLKEN